MKFFKQWLAKRRRKRWLADVEQLKQEVELFKWAYGSRIPDATSKLFEQAKVDRKAKLDKLLLEGINL